MSASVRFVAVGIADARVCSCGRVWERLSRCFLLFFGGGATPTTACVACVAERSSSQRKA